MGASVYQRVKQAAKWCFRNLPTPVAIRLCRGRPNWAFYLPRQSGSRLISDYLGEFTVNINPQSDIERRMLSRAYEHETLAIVSRFVKPGMCVFDVGANVGAVTLAMAKAVGPTGNVHAFEPGPPYFGRLKNNLQLNPWLHHVTANQLGIGATAGELTWQESMTDPGNASMHWVDRARPTTRVEVTTIDDYVTKADIQAIHFIKIDVEGMELNVIQGGWSTIRKWRPVLFFESSLCDHEQRAAARMIEGLLMESNYRLYQVDGDGGITETRYPHLSHETLALPG